MLWSAKVKVSYSKCNAPFKPAKQRLIITACCALHNFIRLYNRLDALFHEWEEAEGETSDDHNNFADASSRSRRQVQAFSQEACRAMGHLRDEITEVMWLDYTTRHH